VESRDLRFPTPSAIFPAMKRSLTLVVVLLTMTMPLVARTWKQASTGKAIDAELIKVEDGKQAPPTSVNP
jgi:hypothetical protein